MYTPSFYRQEITSNKSNDDIANIFQKANWITPDLQAEIESCYPSPGEWTSNSIERNISYSKQAYAQKSDKLFPVGRVFRNFRQLQQIAEIFNNAWSVHKMVNSNAIHCSYSKRECLYP